MKSGPYRLTAQQRRDKAMGGDQLASQIIDLARMHGWLAVHFRPARTAKGYQTAIEGDTGWPDVVVSRGSDLHIWECKRMGEHPRPDQAAWLESLRAAGVDAQVMRPVDWPYIQAVLTAHRTGVRLG